MPNNLSEEARRNRLLSLLPVGEFERLLPHLQPLSLALYQVVYEAGAVIEHAYFPTQGVISAVAVMADGTAIEIATIGNEGMTGYPALLEAERSPQRLFVQVAGSAVRLPIEALRTAMHSDGPLQKLLHRYEISFLSQISQSVACNGLHTIQQRCCRWLLITHDRVQESVLPLTHELLSIMLGVRRPSVTEVLQNLQSRGFIRYSRGKIELLDLPNLEATSCECYRSVKLQYDRLLG